MTYRPWTREDCATAARMWREMSAQDEEARAAAIGHMIARKPHTVLRRHLEFGSSFAGEGVSRAAPRAPVPPHVLAERDAIIAASPRSLTAALLGDPLPGRSALDRRPQAGPSPSLPMGWGEALRGRTV